MSPLSLFIIFIIAVTFITALYTLNRLKEPVKSNKSKLLQQNDFTQTLLAVTHKPNVMNICDRVILVDNGKIAWDGKLEEYKALVAEKQAQLAGNN